LGAAAARPSSKVTFTDVGDSERVNPSIAVEVSIGEVSTFELLSAAVFGTGYCGQSSLEATLLSPTAALSSSREVVVRVVPEPDVPIKLVPMRTGRELDWFSNNP
jgi:hypothetical protein